MDFVHLHCHSEYSLLDGLCRLPALVEHVKALGMRAVALTDHGALYGAIEFYYAAKAVGVKPIVGCELYVVRDRHDKSERHAAHLVVLAEDETGYHNLLQLVSAAQLDGFYYKPRVDHALLERHARGLIALSACRSGELIRAVERSQADDARQVAEWHHDVFGPGHYYIELQAREGIPEMRAINGQLIEIARTLDIPLVATNDVHYLTRDDAAAHDLLLAIQTQTTLSDPNRMRLAGSDYYLRTPEEMYGLFSGVERALANTCALAERCQLALDRTRYHLPEFAAPAGQTPEMYLRQLAERGLAERYADVTADLRGRLDHELRVIHQMGFDTYFLIVWDLLQHARSRGIHWNVRGSAAGSLAAYALALTAIDPVAHHLVFERFLNPDRVSLPDIDMDFPDERRGEMVAHAVEKYGADRVAHIIAFGTLGAKAAIRDVGRALEMDAKLVQRVAALVPAGADVTLRAALDRPELANLYQSDASVRDLIDRALALEGMVRHASTHAAGIVIADRPLVECVPLQRPPKSNGLAALTQYDMQALERLGLLKLDFLGLATLSVMQRTLELVQAQHGLTIQFEQIPLDDPAIYALLSSGDVSGVFQVEGEGFRRVLRQLQPTCFQDVVAVLALYRPGPMQFLDTFIARKRGKEPIAYRHPALEPILKDTYGIGLYQEQVLQLLITLAGYSGAQADTVRRAISKKDAAAMQQNREAFVAGAQRVTGLSAEVAQQIWDDIEFFSGYAFSRSHATDYALITCQTAWLKAHYFIEFMAATLSVSRGDRDKVAQFVDECLRHGVEVLPPAVNHSELEFTIEPVQGYRAIRFALGAIKGLGDGALALIIEERHANVPFKSITDFCARVDLTPLGRRGLEAVIQCGALDGLGERNALLASIERMLGASKGQQRTAGQMNLFGENGGIEPFTVTEATAACAREQAAWEREWLGVLVSDPPLVKLRRWYEAHPSQRAMRLAGDATAAQNLMLAALVKRAREVTTKKGEQMAFVTLDDGRDVIEATVFPSLYAQSREFWQPDTLVSVRAKVTVEKGEVRLLVERVERLNDGEEQPRAARRHALLRLVRSGDDAKDSERLAELMRALTAVPGDDSFCLWLIGDEKVRLDFDQRVAWSPALEAQLASLLGDDQVEVTNTTE